MDTQLRKFAELEIEQIEAGLSAQAIAQSKGYMLARNCPLPFVQAAMAIVHRALDEQMRMIDAGINYAGETLICAMEQIRAERAKLWAWQNKCRRERQLEEQFLACAGTWQ
jgi:signal transduction protein with GAF and PtsI domain